MPVVTPKEGVVQRLALLGVIVKLFTDAESDLSTLGSSIDSFIASDEYDAYTQSVCIDELQTHTNQLLATVKDLKQIIDEFQEDGVVKLDESV